MTNSISPGRIGRVAVPGSSRYEARVRTLLAKLGLLLAVLLMPLGMAPAAATSHHSMAAMMSGHCPDQAPANHVKGDGIADCAMACAAALPAADAAPESAPLSLADTPLLAVAVERLHGLHPETATPPPRAS